VLDEQEGRMATASIEMVEADRKRRSLEELDHEIGELSAQLDAATCRLLLTAAEFDRREGWAQTGFKSCAHWLCWRVGLDLGTARERLRVGRALAELPLIRAAFAGGEVSYSKVRAMTRVATAENEQELLEVARHGTAHHLERLVRLFRACSSTEELERARREHEQRYLRTWTDDEGMLCIRGRLPAEVGALVKQALAVAMQSLPDSEPAASDEHGSAAQGQAEKANAETPVAAKNLPAETRSLDAQSEQADDAQAERELAESIRGTYVPFGPSPRVSPMKEVAPEQRARHAADALGLIAEWTLTSIQTRQAGASEAPGPIEPSGREGAFEVMLHVDAEVLAADAAVGRCELDHGPRLSAETMRRLSCSSPVVTLLHGDDGELLGPGRRTRKISAPLWRTLRSRDRTCCFPGCTSRQGLVVHHIEHWARGGETKLPNLISLCRSHHWALHEGGFRVEGRAPDSLRFFTPDGRELPASPPPAAGHAEAIRIGNHALGLSIGPQTGQTRWEGESMDYHWAVQSLLRHQQRVGTADNTEPSEPDATGRNRLARKASA
jgi:hypothetical protein